MKSKLETVPFSSWVLIYFFPLKLAPKCAFFLLSALELFWALIFIGNFNLLLNNLLFIANLLICLLFFVFKIFTLFRRQKTPAKIMMVLRVFYALLNIGILIYSMVQICQNVSVLTVSINSAQGSSFTTSDIYQYVTPVMVVLPFLIFVNVIHLVWTVHFVSFLKSELQDEPEIPEIKVT